MDYKIVERNIGRAGNKRQMLQKQEEWDRRYGENNWRTGYEINGQFRTRQEVIRDVYDQSYYVFLDKHPELVKELEESGGVFNPHAILSNSVDIQAATVIRYMVERDITFKGERAVPIGSYQPKYNKEKVFEKAVRLGLEIRDEKIVYPKIAYTLNPFNVPCILDAEVSVEAFWQSDIKCLAVKS
jgi:hypothetical protein